MGNASSAKAQFYKSVVEPLADIGCSFIEWAVNNLVTVHIIYVSPCSENSPPSVLDFVHYSQRARDTLQQVKDFIKENVYPKEMVHPLMTIFTTIPAHLLPFLH